MLTDAGFDFNKEYTLSYAERTRPYFPQPTKIAQAVQAQLAEIGIKVKLEMEEWATYLPATRAGEKELFFLGWSEDFPDATNWYDVFLTGTSQSFGNAFPDIVDPIQKAARMVIRSNARSCMTKSTSCMPSMYRPLSLPMAPPTWPSCRPWKMSSWARTTRTSPR